MKIEHIAIWCKDLEKMKEFYKKYFKMSSGEKYFNPKKNFSSYFLSFDGGASRIELMHSPYIVSSKADHGTFFGITHLAISVGSEENVDHLTEELRSEGIRIVGEPRTTGDGYYESVVKDPEGNQIELTI